MDAILSAATATKPFGFKLIFSELCLGVMLYTNQSILLAFTQINRVMGVMLKASWRVGTRKN